MAVASPKLIEILKRARKIVFLTGSGISAESGIPTFRGAEGLWKNFKPEELASFNAFIKNPDRVWEWYQFRRDIILNSKPNAGHFAIKDFEKHFPSVIVVTQNVDNLHRAAGSSEIYELHGNIMKNYCIRCKKRYDFEKFTLKEECPKCDCGGLIRPDVVWFGENLNDSVYSAAENSVDEADFVIVSGSSNIVYPAALLPQIAIRKGIFTVEINIERTELSHMMDEFIAGKSGDIIPSLLREYLES
ncbi:MAG: NAD-dependent deacylase [Ignavibacteriaceae bacterium]|nr:NAD-dependent deacylase [Ignavibacteriaceae bacterium]